MNVHFYFRSKIEPTVEKSVLYEEVAMKLHFRLAGGTQEYITILHGLQVILYLSCTWIVNCRPPKIIARFIQFIPDMIEERKVLNHFEWQDVLTSITTMMCFFLSKTEDNVTVHI